MVGVLISTIYDKTDSIKLSMQRLNIQKLILLTDKESKNTQTKSIEFIERAFGDILKIEKKKVDLYDVLSVARDAIEIIRHIQKEDDIYIDVSQGRKTQAFGVLFACYRMSNRIKEIMYWGDDKNLIILPKLSFELDKDKKSILKIIESSESIIELLSRLKMSKAKTYRLIKNLEYTGLLLKGDGKYKITDAGKIALL